MTREGDVLTVRTHPKFSVHAYRLADGSVRAFYIADETWKCVGEEGFTGTLIRPRLEWVVEDPHNHASVLRALDACQEYRAMLERRWTCEVCGRRDTLPHRTGCCLACWEWAADILSASAEHADTFYAWAVGRLHVEAGGDPC